MSFYAVSGDIGGDGGGAAVDPAELLRKALEKVVDAKLAPNQAVSEAVASRVERAVTEFKKTSGDSKMIRLTPNTPPRGTPLRSPVLKFQPRPEEENGRAARA